MISRRKREKGKKTAIIHVPFISAYPPFMVMCLVDSMHVFIPRRHLPRSVDPWQLRLDDERCGVAQMNDEHVMLQTPLEGCGTTRRYNYICTSNEEGLESIIKAILLF